MLTGVWRLQEKSSSYECFHAHNDIVTVALFAPATARRTHALPSRTTAGTSKVHALAHLHLYTVAWQACSHDSHSRELVRTV